MKFADLKGYIFDLDGTLLASTGLWYGIYRKALARFGIEMPDDYVAHVNHLNIAQGTAYTAGRFGLSCGAEGVAKVWREYAGDAYASAIEMTPHAKELISALAARGKKLGIATALDEDLARACLTTRGVGAVPGVRVRGRRGKGQERPRRISYRGGAVGAAPVGVRRSRGRRGGRGNG